MKNPKTTITGYLTIFVGVANAILGFVKTGSFGSSGENLALILAGIGLLNAKDDNVTNADKAVRSHKVETENDL